MSASRHRPKGGGRRIFGLVIFSLAMMPTPVGLQDLAALIARQSAMSDRWRQYVRVTPFGTVQAATFSFPQPLGSLIPTTPGYTFASLDPRALDITGSIGDPRAHPTAEPTPPIQFPAVNRTLKGDLLVPRERSVPAEPQQSRDKPKKAPEKTQDRAQFEQPAESPRVEPAPQAAQPQPAKPQAAELPSGMDLEFSPLAQIPDAQLPPAADVETSTQPQPPEAVAESSPSAQPESAPDQNPQQAEAEILTDEEPVDSDVAIRSEVKPENPAERLARLFFGADTLGPNENRMQPWREGEAPVLMPMHPSVDPDIKRAAIEPVQKDAALRPEVSSEGETVAPKGEVTGEGRRPMTPAERLGLTGSARVKHERCLTNAVYFEARGESERGQMAVAQVVLNRAFSGYYPDNVCGVVYQNAHRHLACQFTFACDNVRDVVTEPEAWEVAKRIARDSLDGKIWLPEIGKATHYHATYVSPWWVRTMKKHKTLGIHIFYRPTRWGDGSEAPAWGPSASAPPSAAAAKM